MPTLRPLALLPFVVLAGCTSGTPAGGDTGTTGAMAGIVVFEATPTEDAACGGGATQVRIRARKVGCIPPPPAPCTLPQQIPDIDGDARACPGAGGAGFAVSVDAPGRYYVDLVRTLPDGTQDTLCLEDGSGEVLHDVTTDDLDAGAMRVLALGSGPCPPPP